jgi:hypothetical protein
MGGTTQLWITVEPIVYAGVNRTFVSEVYYANGEVVPAGTTIRDANFTVEVTRLPFGFQDDGTWRPNAKAIRFWIADNATGVLSDWYDTCMGWNGAMSAASPAEILAGYVFEQ